MAESLAVSAEHIEGILAENKDIDYVRVVGDGRHFELTIVSEIFIGQSKVKRQLWVYALLNEQILSGRLHAIQMNTWTKSEWEKHCG